VKLLPGALEMARAEQFIKVARNWEVRQAKPPGETACPTVPHT